MRDWINKDLAKYGGNVVTDLVHIAPEIHWGVEFDVTCEVLDAKNKVTETRKARLLLHKSALTVDVKDWTVDALNYWLAENGYSMVEEPKAEPVKV